jgi:hypothetical protein
VEKDDVALIAISAAREIQLNEELTLPFLLDATADKKNHNHKYSPMRRVLNSHLPLHC